MPESVPTTTYWGAAVPPHLARRDGEGTLDHLERIVKNFDYRTCTFKSEEDNMNDRDCQPGQMREYAANFVKYDECCEAPRPESAKATLKALRREAKRIRKQIAAVKKQAKRDAEYQAKADAASKRRTDDILIARQALRQAASRGNLDAAKQILSNAYDN